MSSRQFRIGRVVKLRAISSTGAVPGNFQVLLGQILAHVLSEAHGTPIHLGQLRKLRLGEDGDLGGHHILGQDPVHGVAASAAAAEEAVPDEAGQCDQDDASEEEAGLVNASEHPAHRENLILTLVSELICSRQHFFFECSLSRLSPPRFFGNGVKKTDVLLLLVYKETLQKPFSSHYFSTLLFSTLFPHCSAIKIAFAEYIHRRRFTELSHRSMQCYYAEFAD